MMRTRLGALLVLTGVAAYAVPRSPQAALRSPLALRRGAAARRGPRAGAAAADGERPARGGADASGPSLGELRNFALPALGLWISGPLLTLIDTSAVGLCSPAAESALEIAALGPGGSVCDGASYAFAFLNIATTNLYASATSDGERAYVVRRGAPAAPAASRASSTLLAAAPFLAFFIGSSGAGAAEIRPARRATCACARSACPSSSSATRSPRRSGSKDAVSPLVAMAASAAVNVAGDVLADVSPANRELNDYMVGIVNERTPAPSYLGGWAARARKHEDACLRVVSRCAPLPRDVMLAIVSYWSLPH
ncbi:hypothetical protein JL720_2514 [Aureococcus anophagefferens]|nr:hypothetical protein JL720_2514 [Aureococcus anophagefferens]